VAENQDDNEEGDAEEIGSGVVLNSGIQIKIVNLCNSIICRLQNTQYFYCHI